MDFKSRVTPRARGVNGSTPSSPRLLLFIFSQITSKFCMIHKLFVFMVKFLNCCDFVVAGRPRG